MNRKLSRLSRIAVLIGSCAMLLVLKLPIWRIELSAPQYPEGLVLKIYAHAIGGDVDIVNGLNHYIGMHMLHTRDFVEFIVLPYIIGGFAVIGLIVALVNRKSLFYSWVALFLLIAFTSMIDFYRWEYNYGHNLDPAAPIQVPGMAYQPPLLGYKQLLNFGAYSIPDSGGWVFVCVGVLLAAATLYEFRRKTPGSVATLLMPLFAASLALPGCQSGPQPIRYGQDVCSYCKMAFSDRRFGAEICTHKGKLYKYDDFHCLLSALQAGDPARQDIAGIYFVDFTGGPLILADNSYLLRSDAFRTPMNGNIAAFSNEQTRTQCLQECKGQVLTWKELYK
jgi:copper chaperone NosL